MIDQELQKALSSQLGQLRMTTQVPTGAVAGELQRGAPSLRDERFDVPLLAEDELGRVFDREGKRILILGAGFAPAIAERFIYHDRDEPLFRNLYDETRG